GNRPRERMEAVEDQPDRRMIDFAHDGPGFAMIEDVAPPGERFVPHAQAALRRPFAELTKVRDDTAAIGERGGRDVRAYEQEVGAELLHDVELAFHPLEDPLTQGIGHALEI